MWSDVSDKWSPGLAECFNETCAVFFVSLMPGVWATVDLHLRVSIVIILGYPPLLTSALLQNISLRMISFPVLGVFLLGGKKKCPYNNEEPLQW